MVMEPEIGEEKVLGRGKVRGILSYIYGRHDREGGFEKLSEYSLIFMP